MVLRNAVAAAAAGVALSLVVPGPGVARPAPVGTERGADPLEGLAMHPEWASVTGRPGVLRGGCHSYSYSYTVNPPEGVWALEVFVTGPGAVHVAAGAYLDGYDPASGTGRYKLCRATTRYGRFTIEAKISVDDGAGHVTEGRTAEDHYRLRRPHRGR